MTDLFDLTGKNVLFIGSGGWLGSAMSAALAESGANIILTSRNIEVAKKQANEFGSAYKGSYQGVELDILKPGSIDEALDMVNISINNIDILVNNACPSVMGLLEDMDDDTWQRGMDSSINAVYRITRKTVSDMRERGTGNIINTASMYGVVAPDWQVYEDTGATYNPPCYSTGKAAIIQFTKWISAYYGRYGIRANTIVPGAFPNKYTQDTFPKFVENLSGRTLLRRIGTPDELKGVIVFLASEASSYITGQSIVVDGGWTAW